MARMVQMMQRQYKSHFHSLSVGMEIHRQPGGGLYQVYSVKEGNFQVISITFRSFSKQKMSEIVHHEYPLVLKVHIIAII